MWGWWKVQCSSVRVCVCVPEHCLRYPRHELNHPHCWLYLISVFLKPDYRSRHCVSVNLVVMKMEINWGTVEVKLCMKWFVKLVIFHYISSICHSQTWRNKCEREAGRKDSKSCLRAPKCVHEATFCALKWSSKCTLFDCTPFSASSRILNERTLLQRTLTAWWDCI